MNDGYAQNPNFDGDPTNTKYYAKATKATAAGITAITEVAVTNKGQRKALFETLVGEKFKQVVLVENEIKE